MKIVICVILLLFLSLNISFAGDVKNDVTFSKKTSLGEIKVIVQHDYESDRYPPITLGSQLYINNKLIYKSDYYVGVNKIYEIDQNLFVIIEENLTKYRDFGPMTIIKMTRSGKIVVSPEKKIDGIDYTPRRYDISKLKSSGLINIRLVTSTGHILYKYDSNSNIITVTRYDDRKKLNSRCESLYKIIKMLDCSEPGPATPMSLSREVNDYWLLGDENTKNRFYKECSRMDRENSILKYRYFKKLVCELK